MKKNPRPNRRFELPLLAKELNEQSSRARTYVLRFLYGLSVLAATIVLFARSFTAGSGALGQGEAMFDWLTRFQFWALYLFVPAVTCGCLTMEKERNTLAILLITTLRPWQIIVQKFLGRFVPIVGYVFLSLPLMAVAYSLGGLTSGTLWGGSALLLITVAQTTALAVCCSAYFATTVEALLANFVIFFLSRLILPFCWGEFWLEQVQRQQVTIEALPYVALFLLSFVAIFLMLAIRNLERRAFIPPKNLLLESFKWLDRRFNNLNRVTGGVVLVKDGEPLPGDRPIAWRETAKKSLGTFRYLFRVLMGLEMPLVFVLYMLGTGETAGGTQIVVVTFYLYGLWLLAALMTVIHSASLISSERTRQTLDVLLATPLSGEELLLEKQDGVRRLFRVLLIPFVTIFLFQSWWFQGYPFMLLYLGMSIASATIFMRLLTWVSLAIGLKVKSQIRAVLIISGVVAAWLAIPIVIRRSWGALGNSGFPLWLDGILSMHPTELIRELERGLRVLRIPTPDRPNAEQPPLWAMLGVSLMAHLVATLLFRRYCLTNADRLLGRLGQEESDDTPDRANVAVEAPLPEPQPA